LYKKKALSAFQNLKKKLFFKLFKRLFLRGQFLFRGIDTHASFSDFLNGCVICRRNCAGEFDAVQIQDGEDPQDFQEDFCQGDIN